MSTINKPHEFSPNTTASSSQVNDNFDTIYNEFNGSISAANLASNAVTTAKITDSNVTTAKIADSNVTTAKLADGAVTNAKLGTGAGEPGGAWQSWTPTFTNLSGGTLNYAKYTIVGKTVNFRIKYTLAGAGVSGGVTFTTPTNINSDINSNGDAINGMVALVDTGSSFSPGAMRWASSNSIQIYAQGAGSTYVGTNGLSSSIPFTWGNSDVISISGTYEAA